MSNHNGNDVRSIYSTPAYVPADWAGVRRGARDDSLDIKQLALIRTFRRNPDLAKHVRTLRWTVIEISNKLREVEVMPARYRLSRGEIDEEQLERIMWDIDFNACNGN